MLTSTPKIPSGLSLIDVRTRVQPSSCTTMCFPTSTNNVADMSTGSLRLNLNAKCRQQEERKRYPAFWLIKQLDCIHFFIISPPPPQSLWLYPMEQWMYIDASNSILFSFIFITKGRTPTPETGCGAKKSVSIFHTFVKCLPAKTETLENWRLLIIYERHEKQHSLVYNDRIACDTQSKQLYRLLET